MINVTASLVRITYITTSVALHFHYGQPSMITLLEA